MTPCPPDVSLSRPDDYVLMGRAGLALAYYQQNATLFLKKPFHPSELAERLQEALARRASPVP